MRGIRMVASDLKSIKDFFVSTPGKIKKKAQGTIRKVNMYNECNRCDKGLIPTKGGRVMSCPYCKGHYAMNRTLTFNR